VTHAPRLMIDNPNRWLRTIAPNLSPLTFGDSGFPRLDRRPKRNRCLCLCQQSAAVTGLRAHPSDNAQERDKSEQYPEIRIERLHFFSQCMA
jgi:hypothetical protein